MELGFKIYQTYINRDKHYSLSFSLKQEVKIKSTDIIHVKNVACKIEQTHTHVDIIHEMLMRSGA
jgi:hypothetical protein